MSKSQSQLSTVRGEDSLENKISQSKSQILTSVRGTESTVRQNPEHTEGEEDETEEKPEPTVSSLNPEDRKEARRLRIARRNDAIRKAAQIAEGVQVEDEGSMKTRLETQVEDSAKELERLLLEGRELITNVRVASDSREVARRLDEAEKRESRIQRLEEDAETTKEMYEEVEKKWKELSSSSDPMDLKAEIDAQKEKCDVLLARKDEVIKQLITEVDEADIRFVRDQLKQKKDIAILVERIENHVKLMKESYRNELQLIEDAIAAEKKEMIDTATESWEKLYDERERQETENLSKRFDDIEDQENEVQKLRTEHREKYRRTKIQLETDLQTMQKEMEQIKFQCFLNSEKLDYNYQILQRREEENILIRAQQKRRLNKLQDTLTNLRRRIRLGKEAASNEAVRLNEEVIRLHDNILNIERKADCFANINDKKYHQVWDMNEETARKLLDRIYTIDTIIHEQQLGYEWEEPKVSIPCKTDLPSFRSAMQAVSELFHDPEENYDGAKSEKGSKKYLKTEKEADEVQGKLFRQRLLKHILQRIADASGFLVEGRLTKLLEPYSKCQKTIVLLDNVFDALGLRFEADIELLREYFLPYAVCTECQPPETKETDDTTTAFGSLVECLTQHPATTTEQCEEKDELEEIPKPPAKFSFDSEEVSGICQSGKDEVGTHKPGEAAAPSRTDADRSERTASIFHEDMSPLVTARSTDPLETESGRSVTESIPDKTDSKFHKGQTPQRTDSATRRTDLTSKGTYSGSGRMGSAPSRSGSARRGIDSAPPMSDLATTRAQSAPPATVPFYASPPEVVVSEFLPFAPASLQTAGTVDLEICVEVPSSLLMDSVEDIVPLLPKCPVPPAKECVESHTLQIDPIYVYMALNDFVSKFHDNELSDIKSVARILSRKRNTVSRMLSPDDVSYFWECYRNGFPEERQRLWEGFLKGLNKYYQVLSQRHKLNMEAMALKRQNEELRQLLANYVEYNEKLKHKNGTTLPPLNL